MLVEHSWSAVAPDRLIHSTLVLRNGEMTANGWTHLSSLTRLEGSPEIPLLVILVLGQPTSSPAITKTKRA